MVHLRRIEQLARSRSVVVHSQLKESRLEIHKHAPDSQRIDFSFVNCFLHIGGGSPYAVADAIEDNVLSFLFAWIASDDVLLHEPTGLVAERRDNVSDEVIECSPVKASVGQGCRRLRRYRAPEWAEAWKVFALAHAREIRCGARKFMQCALELLDVHWTLLPVGTRSGSTGRTRSPRAWRPRGRRPRASATASDRRHRASGRTSRGESPRSAHRSRPALRRPCRSWPPASRRASRRRRPPAP